MKKYKKWIAMGVIGFLIFLGFFTGYILQEQHTIVFDLYSQNRRRNQ